MDTLWTHISYYLLVILCCSKIPVRKIYPLIIYYYTLRETGGEPDRVRVSPLGDIAGFFMRFQQKNSRILFTKNSTYRKYFTKKSSKNINFSSFCDKKFSESYKFGKILLKNMISIQKQKIIFMKTIGN